MPTVWADDGTGTNFQLESLYTTNALYNAGSDPFSPSGGGMVSPRRVPILDGFAQISGGPHDEIGKGASGIWCASDPNVYRIGGSIGYDCQFYLVVSADTDAELDDSVCNAFLKLVGVAAVATAITDAQGNTNAAFQDQPMLCAHTVSNGNPALVFRVMVGGRFYRCG